MITAKDISPEVPYEEKPEPNLDCLYNTFIDDMRQVNSGNDPEEALINLETHIGFMQMSYPNCTYQLFLEPNTIDQFERIGFYINDTEIASIGIDEYYS